MNTQLSKDINSQRQRILDWLRRNNTLSTLEARNELDIMHPAARVQELRSKGHHIFTHWEMVDSGKGKHRVANYVLFKECA